MVAKQNERSFLIPESLEEELTRRAAQPGIIDLNLYELQINFY